MPDTPTTALVRLDPQALLASAIEKGATIETLEKLVDLAERVRTSQARQAYREAMARFQAKAPRILKTQRADVKRGSQVLYSYTFAPLGEMKSILDPLLAEEGLSTRWGTTKVDATSVTAECICSHVLGHEESSGPVMMPIPPAGDGGANPMQRVGIARAYAKRQSYQDVLGVAPVEENEEDTDGNLDVEQAEFTPQPQQDRNQVSVSIPPVEPMRDPHAPPLTPDATIGEREMRKLMAIANGQKWTDEQIHALIGQPEFGFKSRTEITLRHYEKILDALKRGPAAFGALLNKS